MTRQVIRRGKAGAAHGGEYFSLFRLTLAAKSTINEPVMNHDVPAFVPVFEPEEQVPEKKRRGVTVITKYGRAVTFGVSQNRTEHFLKAMAQHKYHELTAAMQEQKTERLQSSPVAAQKNV